jgi:two-component system OmpR family sensor kinase
VSLRARLVAALGLLLVVGLTAFGFGTYVRYSRAQYKSLDDQVRGSFPPVMRQLLEKANLAISPTNAVGPIRGGGGGPDPTPTFAGLPGFYAELLDGTGAVVGTPLIAESSTSTPKVPANLPADGHATTVGSATGSGEWRLVAGAVLDQPGYRMVVAVPTDTVTSSLRQLVLIETIAGLAILVGLTSGAWLILRRGLRPLENMADTAGSINAGDLSQRVSPADGRSEVGQLGLAINSMLGELEEAFREREATEQRLRRFLSDASHELRTPLTSIQGFAELFRLGMTNDHVDSTVIARRIEEESARMKTLVEDLLTLARLDETRVIEREPVDLAVLAADACSDAVAADPTRPVSLDAPDPLVVAGDRDQLRQAIANLVSNALKHTPAGTPIEVSAHGVDGRAVLVVRDHGPGLDDEALAHVFDRFWQADQARVGTGAGLGLSIVAAIAHTHAGDVHAANAPEGGAAFTLELPVG